ncbi:hypothetical protein BJY04DRAFT_220786 [Aspergillus karnatakaensis]|uniref:type I polyketide synthase n=1 Tax=Aspergillus karnatakaensis TaxID=1810916 RepID=UPI003CCD40E2
MAPQPPPPLAIIGFAAKYAQEADTAENFWNFLLQARESMTSFPKDRLNIDGYYHPDPEHAGSIHAKGAHFLAETPNAFDAAFFSVNKTEVLSLDPQQRLVMENVYHAHLINQFSRKAGISLATSISSNTSVFVSGFNHDHRDRISTDPDIALKHRPTGAEGSMISGRAIVSGVNVFGALNHILGMSYSGFLSSEGKCFTFDHRASGYSRGEGVGTVILKTLDQALADGDTIRAVVRGTALNHDGRTPGLTYPSGEAQVRIVRELYNSVGLNPAETLYVESHGTGTPAGDPIEAASIARAFESPVRGHPVYIGAVKPNIGHIEGGSGISGIIKAIWILESGVIPPNVNFEKVNPQILVDEWNVRFPLGEAIPWPETGKRRISVNCFGLSGTNAHCILDDARHFLREYERGGAHATCTEPPTLNELRARVNTIGTHHHEVPVENGGPSSQAPKLLLLSGFDQEAPKRLFDATLEYLKKKARDSDSDQILSNLAYTLAEKRSRFRWNSFILCNSITELVNTITTIPPPVGNQKPPRIGFVFTGQGAQYAGMGQQLFQYSAFRRSLETADAYMQNLGSHWSLLEEIQKGKESSRVDEAMISHPACTAIQIALVDLLRSWNMMPTRVVGHSSGEIAAAYCAGKISRQAAWNAAYHRGRLTSHIPNRVKGGMLAVGLDLAALQPLVEQVCEQLPGELGVACFNSPKNNTVSGDEDLLVVLQDMLESQGVFVRRLRTPTAYHSPHMNDIADDYLEAMGQVPEGDMISHEHPVRMFSTSTGKEVVDNRLGNEYWVHNLVSTVKFTTALRSMYCDDGPSTNAVDEILEIGPHCALSSAIKETITDTGIGSFAYRATLDRKDPTARTLLSTTGALAVRGIPVNLRAVNENGSDSDRSSPPRMLVDLPPYPFDHRETGLYESRLSGFLRSRDEPRHFLLGAPTPDSKPSLWSWKNSLSLSENPWLKDHVIAGEIVFPGAGYLVMAIESVRQINKGIPGRITGFQIQDIALKAMLVIPDIKDGVETCISVSSAEESALSTSARWNKFVIITGGRKQIADPEWKEAQSAIEACTQPLDFSRVCDNLESVGVRFGPLFRNISSVRTSGEKQGIMRGTISIPDVAATMPKGYTHPHLIHPATLDAAIQAGVAAICDHVGSIALTRGKIPAFIKEMWISSDFPAQRQGSDLKCYGTAKLLSHDTYNFDIRAWDSNSQTGLLSLAGIRLTPFQSARAAAQENQLFHSIEWGPDANFLHDAMFDFSPPDTDNVSERSWFKELQLAAGLLAIDALQELKGPLSPEAPDHYHRFYELLKKVEADIVSGVVPPEIFSEWQKYVHDADLKRELYERVAARDTNGAVLVRMGTNIVPFLQQTSDPLYHMFGQDDLMARYYDADVEMGPIPCALSTILESVRFTHSGLRVLEVGAGTGSFSARVLSSLCPRSGDEDRPDCIAQYDFTDVSPSFFEKAKVRLEKWAALLNFKKLDLGEDPIKQRFVAGSYDLIVASNVLHATEDLVLTLARMRSLLKPGGKLLFLEGVRQDTIYSNISFSALPGWWLGKESVRQWCPYVPTEQWREYLNQSGFSGLDVTIPSSYYPEFNKVSVMLSTAITTPRANNLLRVVIVESDNEGVATKTSATLIDILQAQAEVGDCTVSSLSELPLVDMHGVICISLLELDGPVLGSLDPETFPQIKYLLTACDRIIWVTKLTDPKHALSSGLIRTIRWERDTDTLNLITLAVNNGSTSLDVSNAVSSILNHQYINAGDRTDHWNAEYKLQSSIITTNRIAENQDAVEVINAQFSEPAAVQRKWSELARGVKIQIGEPGALDSLQWVTDHDADIPLGDKEVEVNIHAVGLNFRDLLTVMGELPQATIGGEASGIVTRVGSNVDRVKVGDRVAYFGDPNYMGTFRTRGRAVQDLVVRVPDDSAFDVAASMPVIWTTVIYSLKHVANLTKGESILIHAAAGGVGQAAVQYAKQIGAEIFATVSTVEKKNLLINEYGIPEDHIFSSRDLSFAAGLRQLAPDGVDVILNSLAGEALRQSWACISHFGRFIEIGKRDLQTGGKLDMSPFLKNTTFSSVDLLTVAKHRPKIVSRLLDDMVQLWSAGNVSEPKPTSVVSYSGIQSALRSLQLGQSMGKIVCVPDHEPIPVIPERAEPYQLESNASYILSGGLGGIGRSIARWMASRGATHLIFLSRSHQVAPAADELLSALEKLGCRSHVFSCNIADEKSLSDVLETVQTDPVIPPIKGFINCSVAWADSTFENMTHTQWQTSLEPKVQGSWNLHQALQSTSTDLDFFVMLSSVAGIVGNRSQANYNAGNTFEDALARYRVSQGLHGASIDLGAVVSVGFMAENREYVKHSLKIATHHTEEQMLAIIDYVLRPDSRAAITKSTAQLVCGLSIRAAYDRRGVPAPKHLQYPLFSHLQDSSISESSVATTKGEQYNIHAKLAAATSEVEAVDVVLQGITKKLSSILSIAEDEIQPSRSIQENGVDSLIEMEFRTWCSKELGATLTKGDITTKSLEEISGKVMRASPYSLF